MLLQTAVIAPGFVNAKPGFFPIYPRQSGNGVDKCTRVAYNRPITAEVAEAISTGSVRQLPNRGKGLSPKGASAATGALSGAAQNMRGTVIQ